MKSDPLLSIVMPSYNYGQYIRKCIESILSQEFSDYELMILDDASTDESPAIIQEYAERDSRIRPILHKENKGVIHRFNEGNALARGEYIHYLAADDYRYPGFLKRCMDILIAHPELGMCCAQYHIGNDEKQVLEDCGYPSDNTPVRFEPHQMADIYLKNNFKIFALSAILKTCHARDYGGLDPKLHYYSDWYLLNEISFKHPLVFIREPLGFFRIHDANFSNVFRRNKVTRRQALANMLKKINEPENRYYKEQVRRSALFTPVFEEFFWRLLFNPKYLTFWPYINQKSPISKRLKRSFKKKLGLGR